MNNKVIGLVSNIFLIFIIGFVLVAGVILNRNELSVYVNSEYNGVIYAGNTEGKNVSLMINVYWGTEHINDILTELDKYNAKCTFFLGGTWCETNETLIKEILSRGHEIGSHGYYHKDHSSIDALTQRQEIKNTHDLVYKLTGTNMTLFAPPGGGYNRYTVPVAKDLGYKTILWTRDTIDWRDKDEALVYNRAVNGIKAGDLILMHPTAHTLKALPHILQYLKEHNLVANTVTETLN